MNTAYGPNPTMDLLLDQFDRLHSPPVVALRVLELTRDPNFDVAELLDCLERDPALSASLLRLINSSYYGVPREIPSLQQAVTYLGRRTLRLAVLGFGLVHSMLRGAPAAFLRSYWRRSLTMASAARKLAYILDDPDEVDADVAFTAALLADLGMAALVQIDPQEYLSLTRQEHVWAHRQAERDALGFDHVDFGVHLLTRWYIPLPILGAVRDHHGCSLEAPLLSQTIAASNLLSEALWTPNSPCIAPLRHIFEQGLGLQLDTLITLANACKSDVCEAAASFDVAIDGEIDISAMERQARETFDATAIQIATDLDIVEAFMAEHYRSDQRVFD
ncbi:MAG: HDOD domain-containing protein [Planctomycetales bacterium]|nr:HDOD domain-containing protein [Planctomycetales bacterium]